MKSKQYAITGLMAPTLFWSTYFIMASQRPEYSFLTKAVSELGSVDAPGKWYWNILGYIIPGTLISIFAIGLHRHVSPAQSGKVPLVGILLSGVLMALSGVFPGDFENRRSLTMLLHTIGSFGSYVFFLIGAFTYPKQLKKSVYWSKAAGTGLLLTWLTILFGTWVFLFPKYPAVGQRIVFLCYFLWIGFYACKLYRSTPGNKETADKDVRQSEPPPGAHSLFNIDRKP
jgi:hypothetical membrane protein